MAANELTRQIDRFRRFWIDYIPDDGVPMFDRQLKEMMELSKKYKR